MSQTSLQLMSRLGDSYLDFLLHDRKISFTARFGKILAQHHLCLSQPCSIRSESKSTLGMGISTQLKFDKIQIYSTATIMCGDFNVVQKRSLDTHNYISDHRANATKAINTGMLEYILCDPFKDQALGNSPTIYFMIPNGLSLLISQLNNISQTTDVNLLIQICLKDS